MECRESSNDDEVAIAEARRAAMDALELAGRLDAHRQLGPHVIPILEIAKKSFAVKIGIDGREPTTEDMPTLDQQAAPHSRSSRGPSRRGWWRPRGLHRTETTPLQCCAQAL